jgi:hypothetical protein
MALHRDIFWVGRQWAVTGYGMQAIDQRLQGKFDIEASRLWEDGLPESLHADGWLNIEDFTKGLALARARYPEPPRKAAPPEASGARLKDSGPAEPPKPAVQKFHMRIDGWPAKFLRQWRVRIRRNGGVAKNDK